MTEPNYWVTYVHRVNRKLNPHIKGGKYTDYLGTDEEGLRYFLSSSNNDVVSAYEGTLGQMMTARFYIDRLGPSSDQYKKHLKALKKVDLKKFL